MMTGAVTRGARYIFTSVPQMPATSTLRRAPSSAMSGRGKSRSSVRDGPVLTAADTSSVISSPPLGVTPANPRRHHAAGNIAWLKLKTVTRTQGHNAALKDGTVTPRGFTFDFEEVPVLVRGFRRMVRGLEFDVSEMAFTTYLCAREHGVRFTALPVFLVRAFHHGAIVYNTTTGIRSPN